MREAVTPLLVTNWFLAWANQSLTRHIQSWGSLHETASRDMASANWAEERERERERERDRTGPVRVIFSKNGSNTMTSYPSYPLSLISHMSHILLSHISNIRTKKWTNNSHCLFVKSPKTLFTQLQCIESIGNLSFITVFRPDRPMMDIDYRASFSTEVGIYKRIQESKKKRKKNRPRKRSRKKENKEENKSSKKLFFFLDHFLGRVLVFFFFLLSCFLL